MNKKAINKSPSTSPGAKIPVLECRAVSKEYIDATRSLTVLNEVNLTVYEGEQLAIMGRSGSGKTTLLQILGGLDVPTRGEVWVNGKNVQRLSTLEQERLRNQSIGYVFQFHHLLPEFSALENVAIPLLIGRTLPEEAKKRAAVLLDQVGLSARLDHKPGELSGGERQRVAIARALVNHPKCLFADEPTGNLDDETAAQVFEVFRHLNKTFNTSIILVTHDPVLAEALDKTYVLHGGKLVEEKP